MPAEKAGGAFTNTTTAAATATIQEGGIEMPSLNAKALEAAQRAADEAYMASNENAVHDAVVAGISAYLSTTSAGVTEEQTAAKAIYESLYADRLKHGEVSGWDEMYDLDPFKASFVTAARAALEASRVAPVSQKEAATVADKIISEIEERFPNWRGYRDLIDCIDCTLHDLRSGLRSQAVEGK